MNKEDVVTLFLRNKFTHKDLLADRKSEAQKIAGILQNLMSIIDQLSEDELSTLVHFKKFKNEYIRSTKANEEASTRSATYYPFDPTHYPSVSIPGPTGPTVPSGPSSPTNKSVLPFPGEKFYFKPSKVYTGHKSGWVFKTGELGLGYYIDEKLI